MTTNLCNNGCHCLNETWTHSTLLGPTEAIERRVECSGENHCVNHFGDHFVDYLGVTLK